jgi:cysteine-rich repeat protein
MVGCCLGDWVVFGFVDFGFSNKTFFWIFTATGTSMATPHVSAVAALLMSQFPDEPTSRIREAMENSAVDLGPCGPDKLFGHGLVDAMAAATYLETRSTGRRDLQSGCVEATVNTRTDNYGLETRWYILRKPSANAAATEVVFRGGPYRNGLRADYTETFFLPSDECFEFRVTDRENDGTCCEYGIGKHEFIFNGQQLLFEDRFEQGELSVTFGCGDGNDGGNGNSPVCGNGVVEAGEQCDNGNSNGNTGTCTLNCQNARCGDGFVQAGEQCDNGSSNSNTGTCTQNCRNARCGDGILQPGEQCDNGSSNSNTGTCTQNCRNARCGDGFVQPGEQCDNGSSNSNTATCTQNCRNARCGDGFVQPGEACDDGNTQNGDGCSSACQVESNSGGGSSTSSCATGLTPATLSLSTDGWSYWQNELYFFDVNAEDDFIWRANRFSLGNNLRYEAEVCLPPSGCYEFYFFDSWGNGLSSGELTFTWNGATALQINAGDSGTPWPGSRKTYWGVGLGNCA